MVRIKAEVCIEHHDTGKVTYAVLLEDGSVAASGTAVDLKQAGHDIGAAFLLEGDQ